MTAFLVVIIMVLLSVIGAFACGYYYPTRWAKVDLSDRYDYDGTPYYRLVVLVPVAMRVVQITFYFALVVAVWWLITPFVEMIRNPKDVADDSGLFYLFAIIVPVPLHLFVVRPVMNWANQESVKHLDDDQIRVLRHPVEDTDKVSVTVRRPKYGKKSAPRGAR
jgi:uncharacterized membrane protein YobD (UPF0266 family)